MKKLRFLSILALLLVFDGCGSKSDGELLPDRYIPGGSGESTPANNTYSAKKGSIAYDLTITPPVAKAAMGDSYELKVTNSGVEKTSSGTIVVVLENDVLEFLPKHKDAQDSFTVKLSGTSITRIDGLIVFDNGSTMTGEGALSGGGGGGSSSGSGSSGGGGGPSTQTPAAHTFVTGVSLNLTTLSLTVGNIGTLTETVAPSNATNKSVSWSSSNEAVVTVSGGIVSAVSIGTATITVTTQDGGKTAGCVVSVNPVSLTGTVTIDGTATVGQTLTANTSNLDGSGNISYQWKRSDTTSSTGAIISGAINSTYTLVAADHNKYISVAVTRAGYSGNVTSLVTDPVTTGVTNVTITLTFAQITEAAPSFTGPTIYLSSDNGPTTATITLGDLSQYTEMNWYITGTIIATNGSSFTLDSTNNAYNSLGQHFLTLEVIKSGIPYNKTVIFTVAP